MRVNQILIPFLLYMMAMAVCDTEMPFLSVVHLLQAELSQDLLVSMSINDLFQKNHTRRRITNLP